MKKSVVAIFVCVMALLCPSFVLAQFGMGCCCPPVAAGTSCATSCVTVGNVTVVPWLGFGYQSLSYSVKYAFSGSRDALFDNLDVRLKNNALWVGSLGLDFCLRQRLRLFGAAGTNLVVSNGGSLGTDRFSGEELSRPGSLNWTGSQVRWWDLNVGGLYCLTDDVAILFGYKGDRLTENPELPGNAASIGAGFYSLGGSRNYSTDFDVITRSPYIGIKICQCNFDFSLVWSPWLTSYDVKIPLRVIDYLYFGRIASFSQSIDSRWEMHAGGGNLLEAFAQAKLNVSRWASMLPCASDGGVNLWLKGSWLQCRGSGTLSQGGEAITQVLRRTIIGDESASGSGDAYLGRYLWAFGISGQLLF